ncbi:MAG: cytochrome c-type biogenesis protein CcmH [Deltaproteobacteria bacterium]|nr:cytochrome c-type biogenesis protein CcmH [Deltaproteobacteria bacterium]
MSRAARLGLALALSLAGGAAWAQSKRGEDVAPEQALVLGPDVAQTVGAPLGPPVGPDRLEEETHALASRIRCPVCQGHSIADSPSETARDMKSLVRAMVAAGYVEDQVFVYFEARYGEFIRLLPRAEGFNLLVWVIPLAALLLGIIVVVVFLGRRRPSAVATAVPSEAAAARSRAREAGPAEGSDLDPWLEAVRREVAEEDQRQDG